MKKKRNKILFTYFNKNNKINNIYNKIQINKGYINLIFNE